MTSLSVESKVIEREKLLSHLVASIKDCQIRYGGRTELATESDERVSILCRSLEEVLVYGLRNRILNKGIAAIRQVSDLVTSVSSGLNLHLTLGNEDEKPVLWWYVRKLLTKHEYDRFLLLRNVFTDQGRGRAWLRSLLNEHSLERYIHIMLSDQLFLEQWYEPWALLRDQERASMLPNLAAGLDSILFAINIDNESFNSGAKNSSKEHCDKNKKNELEPHVAQLTSELELGQLSPRTQEHRRRKKKVPSQLVSFDDDTMTSQSSSPLSPVSDCFSINSPTLAISLSVDQADEKNKKVDSNLRQMEKNSASLVSSLEVAFKSDNVGGLESSDKSPDSNQDQSSYNQAFEDVLNSRDDSFNSYSTSKIANKSFDHDTNSFKSAFSTLSSDSFHISDSPATTGYSHLTPLHSEFTNLIPLSPDGEVLYDFTGDNSSLKSSSQGDEIEVNPENEINSDEKFLSEILSSSSYAKSVSSSKFSTLSHDELRSAVFEISRAKDSMEKRKNEIAVALNKEMETSSTLRAQLSHETTQHAESINKLTLKIDALTRENELLRHQLKKYVGAVQMLRREGFEDGEGDPSGEMVKPLHRTPPDLRDYHNEAVAYETKLIQVAEMHGELIEFNERMQRLLKFRESQLRRLREELIELRGPLPNDINDQVEMDDTISVTSDLDSISQQPRTLINIWIPTAFLAGPSSDTHHVYQIYVRIRDNEWNVYRRFAQFYELHKTFKKKHPVVKTFDFPQKKTFGYKDIGVVENRRLRLQEYLRKLVNLLVSSHSNLSNEPDKHSLTQILPFLLDNTSQERSEPVNKKRFFKSRKTSSNQSGIIPSPQYNGL